jgi:ABC-type amino acid transport system permease subunit
LLTDAERAALPPRVAFTTTRKSARLLPAPILLAAAVLWFGYEFALNAKPISMRCELPALRLSRQYRGFRRQPQTLIFFKKRTAMARLPVGLLNSLLVAALGICSRPSPRFVIGIARRRTGWGAVRRDYVG